MLPETIEDLDTIRDECRAMVRSRARISAGAAVVPIPAADIGTDVALLLKMIPAINRRFGLTPEQISELDMQTRQVVHIAMRGVGSDLVGKMITRPLVVEVLKKLGTRIARKSAAKFVPLLGSTLAATMSFRAMKLVGNAHIDDCYEVARKSLEVKSDAPQDV